MAKKERASFIFKEPLYFPSEVVTLQLSSNSTPGQIHPSLLKPISASHQDNSIKANVDLLKNFELERTLLDKLQAKRDLHLDFAKKSSVSDTRSVKLTPKTSLIQPTLKSSTSDDPINVNSSVSDSSATPSTKEWNCPSCTLINSANDASCSACGAPSPTPSFHKRSTTASRISTPEVTPTPRSGNYGSSSKRRWLCEMCTAENFSAISTPCTVCGHVTGSSSFDGSGV